MFFKKRKKHSNDIETIHLAMDAIFKKDKITGNELQLIKDGFDLMEKKISIDLESANFFHRFFMEQLKHIDKNHILAVEDGIEKSMKQIFNAKETLKKVKSMRDEMMPYLEKKLSQ